MGTANELNNIEALFRQYVRADFRGWCAARDTLSGADELLTFLIEKKLITAKKQQHYVAPRYVKDLKDSGKKPSANAAVTIVHRELGMGRSTVLNLYTKFEDK